MTSVHLKANIMWSDIDDFIVEEIQKDGTILELKNPVITPSGYPGLFTHFVLIKRNIDTFSAIRIISKKLGIPRHWVFLSGMKDKEAITVQRGCVFGVPPEKIISTKWSEKIMLVSPVRELRRIHIGEHIGNHFTIKFRTTNINAIQMILNELVKKGAPNFFGYQRFGVWKPVSHIAGKLIVLGRYMESLMVVLKECSPFFPNREQFLELLEEEDFKNALSLLPKRGFYYERIILQNLLKKIEPHRILHSLPREFLRILVESYQSFLFNLALSEILNANIDIPNRLPLIGYHFEQQYIPPVIKNVLSDILDSEDVLPSNFRIKYLPKSVAKGSWRSTIVIIGDLEYYHDNGNILKFSLPAGSFATVVLREIAKAYILEPLLGRVAHRSNENVLRIMTDYYRSLLKKYFAGKNIQGFI